MICLFMTYRYNPCGAWTATHQMAIQGKRGGITLEDLRGCAKVASTGRGRADAVYREVLDAVMKWEQMAESAKVDPQFP